MVCQLRFNICGLEDSRLANEDIDALASRIPGSRSAFPTVCNIIICTGQIISVLLMIRGYGIELFGGRAHYFMGIVPNGDLLG